MERKIRQTLREIERAHSVRILHAVESGSRAWGFASPSSDYDVRFIYARPAADYLRLAAPRDVIEWQLDSELDVNGWDLQKALRLLAKSNPTLFEWRNSPIVYQTTQAWQAAVSVIDGYFRSKAGLWHYLNTAQANYRECVKGEMVRLKKYFYVIRPILACRWILDKGTPPPIRFADLMEAPLKPAMERLLAAKASMPELGEGARIDELNAYIEAQFSALRLLIQPPPEAADQGWGELDRLFMSIVKGGDPHA